MNRKLLYFLIAILPAAIFYGCSHKNNNQNRDSIQQVNLSDHKEIARLFLISLTKEDYDTPYSYFSPVVKKQMTKKSLQSIWEEIQKKLGPLDTIYNLYIANHELGELVFQDCKFDTTLLTFQLTFNKRNEIIGIFFKPLAKEKIKNLKK